MANKEKYGFIYVWFDRKNKKFYVGSHWGTKDDGYICSSTNMRNNYRNRPNDFRRRVVKIIESNRQDLRKEEQRWLDMIKPSEFGFQYYNINSKSGEYAWWSNEETVKQVSEKLRNNPKTKATWKKKFEDGYVIHNKGKPNPKNSKILKEKYASGELVPWSKTNKGYKLDLTEEQRANRMHCDPSEIGRKGGLVTGKRAYEEGFGMFGITEEQKNERHAKSVQTCKEKGIGIYAITPEQRKDFAGRGSRDTKWVNNGIINKKIKKNDSLPEGFQYGRMKSA